MIEILLPIIIMFAIGGIRQIAMGTKYNDQTYPDQSIISYNLTPGPTPSEHNIPFQSCFYNNFKLHYSIVSSNSTFIQYMENGISEVTKGTYTSNYDISFPSGSKLEDYITSSSYEKSDKLCFAVVLEQNGNDYSVEFRFNITNPFPSDGNLLGDFIDVFYPPYHPDYDELVTSPSNFTDQFVEYGYLPLQNLVDNFLLTNALNKPGRISAKVSPMRFRKYVIDIFIEIISGVISGLLLTVYVVPVCRFLALIVREKESKTKEIMMIMGMTSSAYWLSWITYYFAVYTAISIGMTIALVNLDVFTYSNPALIFIFFWLFGMSCLAFSILLSMFFSKTRSAVLVGIVMFWGTSAVLAAVSDPTTSFNKKTGASLFSTVAFPLVTTVICQLENGQTGIQNNNLTYQITNYNYAIYIVMIVIDIVYMGLLAAYLEVVWPSEWGVKKPWYFLCTRQFWCPRKVKSGKHLFEEQVTWGDSVEPVDVALESQKQTQKAMLVRGLAKHFPNKVAVENFNLDIYEGQIFALLGHNGAGKTTTISMLTGMIPVSAGEMTVQGKYLSKDLKKLREKLGVCPQHNILFPDLTPKEHLYLFCKFKGVKENRKIEEMIKTKLIELELVSQADQQAQYLSGGQKRKLQLAISLIGDSQIVLLDEPTSGMDLTARRHVWDMLKNNKNGRIVILTTHYMEEADVLADRIAIMSEGTLRCCGSSLFLKSRYGVGYYLTMVKSQEAIGNSRLVESFVKEHVTGANLMTDFHGEITFQLPSSSQREFVNFFNNLDQNLEKFGLLSYSISATTLEEVFLRVAQGNDDKIKIEKNTIKAPEESPLLEDGFVLSRDKLKGSLVLKHFVALLTKRAISSKRDFKILFFDIFLPILLIIFGLGLMMIPSVLSNYPALSESISQYNSPQNIYCSGVSCSLFRGNSNINLITLPDLNAAELSDYLIDIIGLSPDTVGSFYIDQLDNNSYTYSFTAFVNPKAYQASSVMLGLTTNQIFKQIDPTFSVQYYNHPLPITDQMNTLASAGNGFTGSTIFALGFSFIPTGIVMVIAREREMFVKRQHIISGVSLIAYWITNFVWDIIKHMFTSVVCSLIILAFNINIYTANSRDYGAMWVLIILGGIAQAPFAYMFSFFLLRIQPRKQ